MKKLLFLITLLTFILSCQTLPDVPAAEKVEFNIDKNLYQGPGLMPDGSFKWMGSAFTVRGTVEALGLGQPDPEDIYRTLQTGPEGIVMPDQVMMSLYSFGVTSDFSMIGHGAETAEEKTEGIINNLKDGKVVIAIIESNFKPTGEVMPHYITILGYEKSATGTVIFYVYDSYLDENPNDPIITIDENGSSAGNINYSPDVLFDKASRIIFDVPEVGLSNTFWITAGK